MTCELKTLKPLDILIDLANFSIKGHGANQFLTDTGTFLKELNMFDNLEFGVTNKDARIMALSARKLLELSFLALLDSGIDYRGRNIGSFVSGVPHDIVSVSGAVCRFMIVATTVR